MLFIKFVLGIKLIKWVGVFNIVNLKLFIDLLNVLLFKFVNIYIFYVIMKWIIIFRVSNVVMFYI